MRVGVAGWSLPRPLWPEFPVEGSHLERYAGRLAAVEINSSFYRPHRPSTYARWAASVPEGFRFAVKVPRTLTHERRLADPAPLLDPFLGEAGALGDRLGPLLVQLPPSLRWDAEAAPAFFDALRARFDGAVACEPRHATWFAPEPEAMLAARRVARVAADPLPRGVPPSAAEPGGWDGFTYWRLHGSPKIYYSDYDAPYLEALAARLAALPPADRAAGAHWCIFDNTAEGCAWANALDLTRRLGPVR